MPMGIPAAANETNFRNLVTRIMSSFLIRAVHAANNFLFYSHTNGRIYRQNKNNEVVQCSNPDGGSSCDHLANNGARMFAAGNTGFVSYSDDDCDNFTLVNAIAAQTGTSNGIAVREADDTIVVPFTGNKLCVSVDNGVSYTEMNTGVATISGANAAFYDSTSGKFFIGATAGYYSLASGLDPTVIGNWVFTGVAGHNFQSFARFNGTLFAAVSSTGGGATVMSSSDNGASFAVVSPSNFYNNLTANVSPTKLGVFNNCLYLLGASSTIEYTTDGIFWQPCTASVGGANIRSAAEFEGIIYACYDNTLMLTSLTA